jgi:hypothetical protein
MGGPNELASMAACCVSFQLSFSKDQIAVAVFAGKPIVSELLGYARVNESAGRIVKKAGIVRAVRKRIGRIMTKDIVATERDFGVVE